MNKLVNKINYNYFIVRCLLVSLCNWFLKLIWPNVETEQCIVRDKHLYGYLIFFMISGNNFGFGPDGRSCKGCGPQEEFYGCADVTIISKTTSIPQVQTSLPPNTPRPVVITRPTETQPPPVTAKPTTTTTTTPVPTTTETVMTSSVKPTSGSGCRAINLWAGNPTLDKWCISNCAKGNCPSSACACS